MDLKQYSKYAALLMTHGIFAAILGALLLFGLLSISTAGTLFVFLAILITPIVMYYHSDLSEKSPESKISL